ncbi:MAG: hypothetical protein BWX88_04342 [Planctomycetes bacterium ADurb.Bin126]|nr:MAG: hypothetical protein BWX88_04342 [Planctomycetes bacterium ADurb.Bin126]
MRFSGHETFSIREGWLHKGLTMLIETPERLFDDHAEDYLGVGRNMAKSIRHWLQATRLAEADPLRRGRLQATPLGHCIAGHDRYFVEPGTWWVLHVNLVNEPSYAETWMWFFNRFNLERFDRAVVVENLRRHVQMQSAKEVSVKTLDRDVACLLSSYAKPIPGDTDDPEEARDCPFRQLDLMSYFRTSGYYQLHQYVKPIPAEVLGYCLSMAFPETREAGEACDVGLYEAGRAPGGPGRAFCLNSESLFEVASRAERDSRHGELQIVGHAGSRQIRVVRRQPIDWVEAYYASIAQEVHHATAGA